MSQLNRWIFASCASLMLFGFSLTNSQAQPSPESADLDNGGQMRMGCPLGYEPWTEKLSLSDEQMERLVSLKLDYETKTAEKRAQLMANLKRMGLLLTDAKVDRGAVQSLNEKINGLTNELSAARVNKMMDAMEVMTPAQRGKIRHHMLEHMLGDHYSGDTHHHPKVGHHH